MIPLSVKLYHLKLKLFGDKELEEKGKFIPCIRCGTMFKSYSTYGELGYEYYDQCRTCDLLEQGGLI